MAHLLIYGGSFDPIHHGHLITCRCAREALKADVVILVPARVSPHKTEAIYVGATGAQRLAMVERAIMGEADFRVDGRELERAGPSYTIDTLEELSREFSGSRLTLLIGADQLGKFSAWHRVEEIVRLAGVAVLPRVGTEMAAGIAAVKAVLGVTLTALHTPLVDISATGIRERVGAGMAVSYFVPQGVADYIREEDLYQISHNARRSPGSRGSAFPPFDLD